MKRVLIFIGLKTVELLGLCVAFAIIIGWAILATKGILYLNREIHPLSSLFIGIFIIGIAPFFIFGNGYDALKKIIHWNWRKAGKIAGRLIIVLALVGMVGCCPPPQKLKIDSCSALIDVAIENELYKEAAILCQLQRAIALGKDKEMLDMTAEYIKLQLAIIKKRLKEYEKKNSHDPVI